MPAAVCPRCQRANPAEAAYCHFDGTALRTVTGPNRSANAYLGQEFVFPSGRRCRTFDDLVQGCQYEWEDARALLRAGVFRQYLAGIGRMDLIRAAEEAQKQPDVDIALHNFVAALPASQVQGPRLELNPRRLALGNVRAGETRHVKLTIANGGKGFLQGKLTVAEGRGWLRVAGADGDHCPLKTNREQQVLLQIETRALAAPMSYTARLTVITNGGIAEVPIGLDLVALPFPRPPFQGVGSPREMAERMRAQPKHAVPLLEAGELARWFTANGWTYPVSGRTAKGVAAVQQFFEGMGLSKPPPLQVSSNEFRLLCLAPEVARGQVTLSTTARKWVYAYADGDRPWLKVTTPSVSGPQQATVSFEVDSSLMHEGRQHEGTIHLEVNANQKLQVRVLVDVRSLHEPFTRRLLRPFFAGALLFLICRLLLAVPADLFARVLAASPRTGAGSFGGWLEPATADGEFIKHFVLATWWLGAVVGGMLLGQRGTRWADVLSGILAGGVAGILTSATLGCVLPFVDTLPRLLWHRLGAFVLGSDLSMLAWLWAPIWIITAAACWGLVGGLAGLLLRLAGKRGREVLEWAARPVKWVAGLFGWKRLAAFFGSS
jgi:hypothetical protein